VFPTYILNEKFFFRITVHPLPGIAGFLHKAARGLIDLHQLRQIGRL
jgi:hypothetical protein